MVLKSGMNADFNRERGYTLTEMMVVVTIMMVVALMPIIMINSTKDRMSRQAFVRELKSAFERARFDSVKRRPETSALMAKVVVSAKSYQLTTYANRTGTVDSTGTMVSAQTQTKTIAASDMSIVGHSSSGLTSQRFPVTITFDSRGEILATDSSGVKVTNPAFVVCQGNCSSYTGQNSNIILVSPTGTVNLLAGDASIPTFTAPSGIATVSQGTSINRLVTVSNN